MNAGGVLNACKSNGSEFARNSGERVSNAWATCPPVGNNPAKAGLIPHEVAGSEAGHQSLRALGEGPASYQLVGGVTAYQGDDG